jgi:hypothetical protein
MAKMTSSTFEIIAEVVANRFNQLSRYSIDERHPMTTELLTITEDLIVQFRISNPKFNRARFIKYVNSKRIDGGQLLI